jgi:hypothetical protein
MPMRIRNYLNLFVAALLVVSCSVIAADAADQEETH